MIPLKIHYCWFGHKPLPDLAKKCIASWKKYLPEHQIIEWNEDNFDINQIPYTAQAYKCKKYAFVSDFARFKIMYEYGGIYFDTDVEVIKSMDDILAKGPFFGIEASNKNSLCAPGLGFACYPKQDLCKEMLNYYENTNFIRSNGDMNLKTVVHIFSEILQKRDICPSTKLTKYNGVYFYPPEYFCPINYYTGEQKFTSNTHTIHHYAASWKSKYDNVPFITKIWKFLHLPQLNLKQRILNHLPNTRH